MTHVHIQPEKLAAANRWANLLPVPERKYAFAHLGWLRGGAEGQEPERGQISKAAAGLKAEYLCAEATIAKAEGRS